MNERYKDRRYANRGQTLEEFLTFSNNGYRRSGVAVVWKVPTAFKPVRNAYGQVVNCKVEGKSCVDYLGRLGSTPLAMEAKETKSDSIRFDAVQDHQADFLTDYQGREEAISIVVVSFNLNSFYTVPWPFWREARNAWKEAQLYGRRRAEQITVEYNGQTWTTPGKASVREEELLREWQVPVGGFYGLDYLHNYRLKKEEE